MAEAADFQGTSPSPARRWLRRTGALLTGAPLLAGFLQLPAAAPADAAAPEASQAPAGAGSVAVSVDSLTPGAPTDGDTLTVSGTVTNKGKQPVTDAHVGLRLGPLLNTRSAIDSVAKNGDDVQSIVGAEIDDKFSEKFSELAPGVPRPFTLSVPVDELNLGQDGVYQLAVSLAGETSSQPWEQTLGIQRTFLPWQPEDVGTKAKTRTTFMWPLISTVHMTAETRSDEQQTPVLHDDDLAKEISPGGRLDRMVALGKDLDVTWVIDPDLLATVEAMTGRYEIPGEGEDNLVGGQQDVAKRWLTELQEAVADKEVVALPFGDPDLASLAHNGTSVTGSLSHLKEATEVASSTVESILHVKPTPDFAWPVNGAVDPSVIRVATSAGADKVIARSDTFEERGLTYTPTAPRPIGGGTTAVVSDARLSTAFQGDMTKASTSTLAVQRFLAQSLTLGLQTDRQRSVVVAPQRTPSASQAQTMAEAFAILQDGTWSQSQNLTAAAKAKPDPAAATKVPAASSYPSSLRKRELPKTTFEQIARTQDKLDKFKVILSDQSRVVTPFGRALNRGMSVSWRGRESEAAIYRSGVEAYLDELIGQVRLIDKSETKLSGRSATIPVTVQNNLVQGVEHLVLRLTSTNPTRLEIGGDAYEEQPVAVSGGHSQSVKFTTSANANGRATVVAQLYTQDGQKYGAPVTFDVKVTEITATVMLVIGGGVLLLVLAGFRMYTQRKRAAARDAEEQDPEPEADEDADGPQNPAARETRLPQESAKGSRKEEPEQPSDPAPDTAPESAGPSGPGERVDR
ncbi:MULTISPECIES: DUF6049 family protein [unclassified Streptomyces]|uniref:DUF6049 family protein n=1 Tax=unclassified Streptomyces TaxID=2593676 RepID=UPI000F6C4B3D|nr:MULTISPECIES: DUF6049 family protein [unclassified Streptomyces]AZM61245.1 hypothetical protein DLM49_18315 [Streptomyces sp. WAC 01438]RSM89369.1 hypothetical protein DMA10_30450 [Streptomyces sp. WAC 01420]